jgi:hypothetical protein
MRKLIPLLAVAFVFSCNESPKNSSNTLSQEDVNEQTQKQVAKIDINCLTDVDWCTPNCNDPKGAWKFASDGTFNYSTTFFGGMSSWGNWQDLGDGKIQITYTRVTSGQLPPDQVLELTNCDELRVGQTTYRH